MNTLVLKCQASVDNENLRSMNELQLTYLGRGTGAGYTTIRPVNQNNLYSEVVQYRIIEGNGSIYNTPSGTNKGQSYDVQNSCAIKVDSDMTGVLQIKNFDLCTDVIGTMSLNFCDISSANAPAVLLNTQEIKDKTFLKEIHIPAIYGQLDNLKNLTELVYLGANLISVSTSDFNLTGKLSSLYKLKKLSSIIFNTANIYSDLEISFDDIINMSSLQNVLIAGSYLTGGDFYTLCTNKTNKTLSIKLNGLKDGSVTPTCSYSTGDELPTFTLEAFLLTNRSGYAVYTDDKVTDVINFLTMLKDGINANKITLASSPSVRITCTSAIRNNSTVSSLVTDLSSLGLTIQLT